MFCSNKLFIFIFYKFFNYLIFQKSNKSIKKTIINSAEKFSGHGISNIFGAENVFTRVVWLILYIFALILCVYFIWMSLAQYLTYDVVTHSNKFFSQEITFPAVIFCIFGSSYNFKQDIVTCTFDTYSHCNFTNFITEIPVMGYGFSRERRCIKMNTEGLNVKIAGVYSGGLTLTFALPEYVSLTINEFMNSNQLLFQHLFPFNT